MLVYVFLQYLKTAFEKTARSIRIYLDPIC